MPTASIYNADATQPQSVTLETREEQLLEAYGKCTHATTFYVDASEDGITWIEGYDYETNVTVFVRGYFNSWNYIRLRTAPVPVEGAKVTLILTARKL